LYSKALIIPAAGAGKRMQHNRAKPFIALAGVPIVSHTIRRFLSLEGLEKIIIATSQQYLETTENILEREIGNRMQWECVEGGTERQQSVHIALDAVKEADVVIVHDAVRPFVTLEQIIRCCKEAEETGAAVLGVLSKDTIKKVDKQQLVTETPDRALLWQVQTPQVFSTSLIKKAYDKASDESYMGTDDASLVEWLGEPVKMVKGSARNFKITYPHDLELARILLKKERS
jgi:2-C-methyl-D-erythritol 4-phosphate cytidylyltransferase